MDKSFWDHLEELRGMLIRCAAAWLVCAVAAFCLRDVLFDVLFAPSTDGFVTYRLLHRLARLTGCTAMAPPPMDIGFINIRLAAPFMMHIQVSLIAGLLAACPYILYRCYAFLAPALYLNEKRYARRLLYAGSLLFVTGVLLNYFVIFPFAFRMLAHYQVYATVPNQISLDSYIYTLLILSLVLGVLFELPVVTWCLAKMGIVNAALLRRYRKHALVAILILAAVITPTGDAITLLLVTLPLYLLYILSIALIRNIRL